MSDDIRCGTCMWWQAGRPPRAAMDTLPGHPEMFLGVCVSNPPVVVGATPETARAMFPQTHENRACGMWMPDTAQPFDDPGGGEPAPTENTVVRIHQRRAA